MEFEQNHYSFYLENVRKKLYFLQLTTLYIRTFLDALYQNFATNYSFIYVDCLYSLLTDFPLYRYDFRAGFWGVIGGPCLGIIPVSSTILT